MKMKTRHKKKKQLVREEQRGGKQKGRLQEPLIIPGQLEEEEFMT